MPSRKSIISFLVSTLVFLGISGLACSGIKLPGWVGLIVIASAGMMMVSVFWMMLTDKTY